MSSDNPVNQLRSYPLTYLLLVCHIVWVDLPITLALEHILHYFWTVLRDMVYVSYCLSILFWQLGFDLLTSPSELLLIFFDWNLLQLFGWTLSFGAIHSVWESWGAFFEVMSEVHGSSNCLRLVHEDRVLLFVLILVKEECLALSSCCDWLLRWWTLSHGRVVCWILPQVLATSNAEATISSLVASYQLWVNPHLVLTLRSHYHWWLVHPNLICGLHVLLVVLLALRMRTTNACGCSWACHEGIMHTLYLSVSLYVGAIWVLSHRFLNQAKKVNDENLRWISILTCGWWFTIFAGFWLFEWTPIEGFLPPICCLFELS